MGRNRNRQAPEATTAAPPQAASVAAAPEPETRYGKAAAKLRTRLEQQPGSVRLRVALAEALFRSTFDEHVSPAEALRRLNEAVTLDPFRPAFYYHRGVQWHRLGNTERALANYGRALQFNPDNPRILHQMALAHLDAGRADDARAKWDEAEEVVRRRARRSEAAKPDGAAQAGDGAGTASLERALFFIQCGRAEAELRAGAGGKALECLRKVRPPLGCAALVGEMALKYLLMTGDAASAAAWLDESLDAEEGEKVRVRLRPYLEAYGATAGEEFPLKSVAGESHPVRALRALAAFDWARRGGEAEGGGLAALKSLIEEEPEEDTLLDAYLALLHDEAARLYEAEEWGEACGLWREALLADRHNHAVTHNLALAATRAGEEADYAKWWDKTQRLWYTRHLILPESETYRGLISGKHFAFATKAADLAARKDGGGDDPLEAVSLWVDEMERYFLCEQYSFASAYHLLGVPPSADDEAIRQARDVLRSKTEHYSDTLPDLKDALKRTRLKRLEEAYKAVADASARKAYRAAQDRDEVARAETLRKRKVGYIIAVSNFLAERAKKLPVEAADAYARVARQLLGHPYRALHRQFRDALATEEGTEASDAIRDKLADFYIKKCYSLLQDAEVRQAEIEKVKRILEHLRELNPGHWEILFRWSRIEGAMGNGKRSAELMRAAYDACPDDETREEIRKATKETEREADFQEYMRPAEEHMKNRRWAEALALIRLAIRQRPKMLNLYYYAVRCLMGLERWDEALAQLDQMDMLSPMKAVVYLLRVNCLLGRAVEEITKGRRPRLKRSVADVRQVLEEARRCPDFAEQAEEFRSFERQLAEVEGKLA